MQRVQKNREERQQKAQKIQRQRRKRLTTSAFYTSLMKDSQDSLASSQYDDFVQDPILGGLYFKSVPFLSSLHLQYVYMFDF